MTQARPLRSDAARNQLAIIDAARAVLVEYGTEASIELIASRAGVGVGTVYRHFPNKDALIGALVRANVAQLIEAGTVALERPDGLGFEEFVRVLGCSLAAHHGYAQILVGPVPVEGTDQLRRLIAELASQARRAGTLAPWVTTGDVMALIWGLRGIAATSGSIAPRVWERHFEIHLYGLRAPAPITARRGLSADQLSRIAAAGA